MQGKVVGHSIVIMDSFALPVQGTETRVNAANEANEYMVQYIQESEKVRHLISRSKSANRRRAHARAAFGIAGGTVGECDRMVPLASWVRLLALWHRRQHANEQPEIHRPIRRRRGAFTIFPCRPSANDHGQIDPNRTISAGRVDIGAFRTYPAGYSPPNASASEYQNIPLNKIEDFGVHANQYYSLEVQIFKSSLDAELLSLLWNKYWVNTLSQSPLISVWSFAVFCTETQKLINS